MKVCGHDRATGVYHIHGGLKTEAGIRSIPVHPNIQELVEQLAVRCGSNGYLIRVAGMNRWNKRGSAMARGSAR